MALGFSLLASDRDTANTTVYADTESTQPAAGSALLWFIWCTSTGTAAVPSSVVAYGATWNQTNTQLIGTNGARLTVFEAYAGGSPSASNATVNFGAGHSSCHFDIIEITGADTTDFTVQSVPNTGTGATSSSVTLAAFGDATNNGAVSGTGILLNTTITPDATATWNEHGDAGVGTPNTALQTQSRTGQDTTVTTSWTGSTTWASIAVEVKMAAAVVLDEYAFAEETDTAMAFDASSNILDEFAHAEETDAAMPFSADSNVLDEFAFAEETDAAMPFSAIITVEDTYGFAEETDAAMPFSADSNLVDDYAFAEETDAAMPFTADSDLIDDYGFADETDAAMPFSADTQLTDEYAFASETDEAMPFLAASDTTDDYAFAEETDAAMPFTATAASTNIEFDASSEGTATTGALSFTHTPVGDPAGVEVDVVVNASVADEITGVTYGGEALTLKADARESVDELGRVQVWFLGTGIPTGAQTVVVSHTGSANAKWATCKSWTGPEDLVIVGTGNISDYGAGASDATIPMWSLANAVRSGALFTGLLDVSNPVPIAGMTADENHDFGSTVAQSIYETAQSSGSTEFGWGDIADETAVAAITITVESAVPVGTLEVEAISFHAGQPQGVADIVGIHPSPGTAGGVLVLTSNLVSSAWITDIDYGGEAMTAVVSAADTNAELWRVDEYNLLSAVPTGDQIFTVNTASSPATTDQQFRTVVVVTFATPVEKVVGDTDAENQDDPQAALNSGAVDVIRFGILGSGLADPANITGVNLPERIQSLENGASSVVTDFDPTASSGSVTVGWSTTASDDVAAIYTAYGEPQDILDEYAFADETDTAMPFLAATDQTVEFAFASETDEAMPFEAEAAEAVLDEYAFAEETDTAMPFIAEAEEPSPGDSPSPPDEGSPESPPESPVDSPIIDSPDDDSPEEPPFESPDTDPADLCFPVFMARRCN